MRHLQRPIAKYLANRWKECLEKLHDQRRLGQGRFDDIITYQQWLNHIQSWPAESVAQCTKEIMEMVDPRFSLKDCLKVIFIARVSGLAAIRQSQGDDMPLSVSIPTVEAYLHHVMVLLAREIAMLPALLRHDINETPRDTGKKRALLMHYIGSAIRDAITDLLPHSHIMESYLSQTLAGLNFEPPAEEQPVVVPQAPPAEVEQQQTEAPKPESVATLPSITSNEQQTTLPTLEKAKTPLHVDVPIDAPNNNNGDAPIETTNETAMGGDTSNTGNTSKAPMSKIDASTGLSNEDDDESGSESETGSESDDDSVTEESESEPEPPRKSNKGHNNRKRAPSPSPKRRESKSQSKSKSKSKSKTIPIQLA